MGVTQDVHLARVRGAIHGAARFLALVHHLFHAGPHQVKCVFPCSRKRINVDGCAEHELFLTLIQLEKLRLFPFTSIFLLVQFAMSESHDFGVEVDDVLSTQQHGPCPFHRGEAYVGGGSQGTVEEGDRC